MQKLTIESRHWQNHRDEMTAIRRRVFIEEQKVPEELEWDEYDERAFHVVALTGNKEPVATGRIKKDGHIGRMAVLKNYRQQGIGSSILLALLDIARRQHLTTVYLHAQVNAIGFYEQHGFVCSSDEFLDAGIIHKTMIKQLK